MPGQYASERSIQRAQPMCRAADPALPARNSTSNAVLALSAGITAGNLNATADNGLASFQ